MIRKTILSKEERDIEKNLGGGTWKSAPKEEITRHVKTAQAFVRSRKKEGRINIRIADGDLALLKKTAESEGLPYQTFMASVLHKYVNGQLVDRKVIAELKGIMTSKKRAKPVKT
ncbi:MAG: hypothetical protein HZA03_11080 [Nitrospinae bacterium]|nr:hypothetical protein [Nitrospinota bacterium]